MSKELPKQYSHHLRIGTCSWKYDSWKGLIYDPDKNYRPDDYLPEYAKHYNSVEIDQWFWSLFPTGAKLPDSKTVRMYSKSVPDDFVFSVKAPNSITLTHYYGRQPAKYKHIANKPNENFLNIDLLKKVLELLQPMEKKLGPIMFQFEYLNKQKMSSQTELIDKLSEFFHRAPKGFDYALELRNPQYLNKKYFDFLREMGISAVMLEGYYMPPITDIMQKHDISTGQTIVIRLHGPDRQEIEKVSGKQWDKIVSPKDESMNSIVETIDGQIERGRNVVVNVNNHYEGCAVLTIDKIIDGLERSGKR